MSAQWVVACCVLLVVGAHGCAPGWTRARRAAAVAPRAPCRVSLSGCGRRERMVPVARRRNRLSRTVTLQAPLRRRNAGRTKATGAAAVRGRYEVVFVGTLDRASSRRCSGVGRHGDSGCGWHQFLLSRSRVSGWNRAQRDGGILAVGRRAPQGACVCTKLRGHGIHSMARAEVAEWQTRRSQKPLGRKAHVGSTPTFGTNLNLELNL